MGKILKPYREVKFGDILLDEIKARDMSVSELSEKSGLTLETVQGLIDNKIRVTADIAAALCKTLEVSADFWINLDINCQKTAFRYSPAPVRYIKEM